MFDKEISIRSIVAGAVIAYLLKLNVGLEEPMVVAIGGMVGGLADLVILAVKLRLQRLAPSREPGLSEAKKNTPA